MTQRDCIRRANSVWTTCPCDPCRAEMNYKSKLQRNGHYKRVPSDDAWAVIHRYRAYGWSSAAIASAAGVTERTIQGALWDLENRDHVTQFGPTVSRRIVNLGDPTEGLVGVTGSTRRLRGLARQQFNLEQIAADTGIGFSTLAAIRGGTTGRTAARFHTAIRDYATDNTAAVGESTPAGEHAIRKGWPSLLAWDDHTIDDPEATPLGALAVGARRWKTDYDPVVVERFLADDITPGLWATIAEKRVIVRKWVERGGSQAELERRTGWRVDRYIDRTDGAA